MNSKFLTLSDIASNTEKFSQIVRTREGKELLIRPLLPTDVDLLTHFLEHLSDETRKFSTFDSYDKKTAIELCDAINKYDKLRFVLHTEGNIVGLFEITLDMPESVIDTYKSYGLDLIKDEVCRFGPTLADEYQNQGLGSELFPFFINIAKQFGKKEIILYGGVLADNARAIHYYKKNSFKVAGKYYNDDGVETVDMILDIK